MNWEESRALTTLKRDFLKAFFDRSHVIEPLDLGDFRVFVRGLQLDLAELAFPQ